VIDLPLAAYVSATFVLVITPGAATAVVVRNALEGGWRGGLATAAGVGLANATHAAAAGLGLAVLIHRSPTLFALMRSAGGLYLAWLALGSLQRAWRGGPFVFDRSGGHASGRDVTTGSALRQGLGVNLLNPAVVTFYLAVVPGFIPPGAGTDAFIALASIHIGMALGCHLVWTFAFDQLRGLVARPGSMRILEAAAGATLLVLAIRTITGW
jgi:threonine/homoserine/homoserine lactone efflux protein